MGPSLLVLEPQVGLLYWLQMVVACGALIARKEGSAGIATCCCLSNTNSMWMTLRLNLGLLSENQQLTICAIALL